MPMSKNGVQQFGCFVTFEDLEGYVRSSSCFFVRVSRTFYKIGCLSQYASCSQITETPSGELGDFIPTVNFSRPIREFFTTKSALSRSYRSFCCIKIFVMVFFPFSPRAPAYGLFNCLQ
ncbi:hypothetical protein RvY_01891 [Ramazzottius varieornatus]|uniref:Uncharacterized protein n=1 Tax=Ramazzottius varieornatus TaxID=947166 RepID=A0A1D1UNW1_RAMVA|nr:hypothetical protein RvY_01891 [Ramazzottius varieornatus]